MSWAKSPGADQHSVHWNQQLIRKLLIGVSKGKLCQSGRTYSGLTQPAAADVNQQCACANPGLSQPRNAHSQQTCTNLVAWWRVASYYSLTKQWIAKLQKNKRTLYQYHHSRIVVSARSDSEMLMVLVISTPFSR